MMAVAHSRSRTRATKIVICTRRPEAPPALRLARKMILDWQSSATGEIKPGEMVVVTVGYIRAGTKNNIIPDQAELGLTVRSYKADVRKQALAAIPRITKAESLAAGAPKEPLIE